MGVALYRDVDADARCGAGDELVLSYDAEVVPPASGGLPFELPVDGDSLGAGAWLRPGPGPSQLTVVLGEGPRLRTRGLFDLGRRTSGSPSGIANARVEESLAVRSRRDGRTADIVTTVDLSPDLAPSRTRLGTDRTDGLALGDLDGDGDLDVVTLHGDLPLRVWRNAGAGRFDDGSLLIPARQASAVALGDLDGDRDLDLVVGSLGQAAQVWWNRGSAEFERGPALASGRTRAIALGDLDGDRRVDVLLGDDGANRVWFNRGGGRFEAGLAFGATATRDLALGDIDGDGDLDAVEAVQSGSGRPGHPVWKNDGRGVFHAAEDLGRGDALGVVLIDLDRDGDLDLLSGDRGRARVLLGNGRGLFMGGTVMEATVPWAPAVGDIDGDGLLDLVQSRARDTVWLRGDGRGGFQAHGGSLPVGRATDSALEDVDGDGDLDLLIATEEGTSLWWGSLAGTRGPVRLRDSRLDLGLESTLAMAVADLDRDGFADLVQAGEEGVRIRPGRGREGFDASVPIAVDDDSGGAAAIGLADVDGNGRLDLFVGGAGVTRLWLAPAKGFRYRPGPLMDSGLAVALEVADFDRDGDLDLALGLELEAGAALWLQEAGLRFERPRAVEGHARVGSGAVGSLLSADLDGDGRLDLVVGSRVGQPTRCLRNRGAGSFEVLAELPGGVTLALAAGDIDRDGDIDLLCGDAGSDGFARGATVWRNDGRGGFTRSGGFAAGGVSAAKLIDIDGDGWLDALLGFLDAPCAVWLGTRDGGFREEFSFGAAPTSALLVHDFDSDGDLDVVQGRGSGFPDRLWWQE